MRFFLLGGNLVTDGIDGHLGFRHTLPRSLAFVSSIELLAEFWRNIPHVGLITCLDIADVFEDVKLFAIHEVLDFFHFFHDVIDEILNLSCSLVETRIDHGCPLLHLFDGSLQRSREGIAVLL